MGRYNAVKHVDSCFLQIFLWERFSTLTPKPMEFSTVLMEEVVFSDGSRGIRPSNSYKPRAWRWPNTKQAFNNSLVEVIGKDHSFCFRTYSYTPPGIKKPQLLRGIRR